jgi:hypothetical protein
MTRLGRRLTCAALLATGMGLAAASPAAAAEPTELGWWWLGRPAAVMPALFAPVTEVPDGGLYVAVGSGGPTAISALRYAIDADATTLTLVIASVTGTVAIDACPAATPWVPAENGGWDQRPQPDCGALSVSGTVDEAKRRVTFPVSSFQRSGILEVVLVPGASPDGGDPAAFEVAFEPPDADSLETTTADAESTDVASGPIGPTAPDAPGFSPSLDFTTPTPAATTAPAAPASGVRPVPRTALTAGFLDDGRFDYPALLGLPLILLCAASYLGWAFTQPIAMGARARR